MFSKASSALVENGELLGVIATVDLTAGLVDLHLTTGEAVALEAGLLVNEHHG